MDASTPKPPRMPKAILFDLDGTLVDSAPDIAAAVNELLAASRLPPLSVAQVTGMIGGGVRKLVERAFAASRAPLAGEALDRAERDMAPIYLRHLTRLTRLLPGAREAIVHFSGAGIPMAVATNKPQVAARTILLHFGLFERLGALVGGDAVTHKKPAPDALLAALEKLGVAPADALMVGDSISDVKAARAAGMPVALIRGGYTETPVEELGADLVCDSLLDLPAALERPAVAA
ncbi:phosphoglycolate phosphatase [Mesorhizobium sp. LHD-90]|uniref:phosphoglycolate phosphatase n=1 Tax=Mesorhizobium sp. LHD-90 TaxID=3071414 RepID=UPI0027DF27CE|nr:phosphoglycolate phosphatase [Mesorhizobium sp. LHD-90]MDQ6435395.1 phosphoglycolate phosphatase [Mesorhizobium sp. LHD-90]